MVFASKTDVSWSTLSVAVQSKNGVLVDTAVALVAVITQRLLLLVPLATVHPLDLEASVVAVAASAAVASEVVSVVEEEEVIEAASGAALVEVTEVGTVAVAAAAEAVLATAMASLKAHRPGLADQEAVALEAAVTATAVAAMAVVIATLAAAQDTAIDRPATAMEVAAAIANLLEAESVAVVATATATVNATTTASDPTTEMVATTNRASKEGTERSLGLFKSLFAHGRPCSLTFKSRR